MIAEQVQEFLAGWLKLLFHPDVLMIAGMGLVTYAVAEHWDRWAACLVAGGMLMLIAIAGGKRK